MRIKKGKRIRFEVVKGRESAEFGTHDGFQRV
jgi:hypothetical protein